MEFLDSSCFTKYSGLHGSEIHVSERPLLLKTLSDIHVLLLFLSARLARIDIGSAQLTA